jgi:hypothetical protein
VIFLLRLLGLISSGALLWDIGDRQAKSTEEVQHFIFVWPTLVRLNRDFLRGSNVDHRRANLFYQVREIWQCAHLRLRSRGQNGNRNHSGNGCHRKDGAQGAKEPSLHCVSPIISKKTDTPVKPALTWGLIFYTQELPLM